MFNKTNRLLQVGLAGSLCLAVLLSSALVGCAPANDANGAPPAAPTEPDYYWRMANSWVQEERNVSMQLFADLVNQYTDGRVHIDFYPDGLLGTHDEMFHAVQAGDIEIANVCPYVHLIPGGMLNWMPWTISTYDQLAVAVDRNDGILFDVMTDVYDEVGLQLLWFTPMGPYGVGSNVRPITHPDDFEGQVMRVSGSLGFVRCVQNMSEGTGLALETIPWADVYGALERGVVDSAWSLWGSLIEERHYEVLTYYTDLGFGFDQNNVAINQQLWQGLPLDIQDAIMKAGVFAEERDFEIHRRIDKEYQLVLRDFGLEIHYPTPEEKAVFRERARMGEVWEELCLPWFEDRYPDGRAKMNEVLAELDHILENY